MNTPPDPGPRRRRDGPVLNSELARGVGRWSLSAGLVAAMVAGSSIVLAGAEPTSGTVLAGLTGASLTVLPERVLLPELEPEPTETVMAWHRNLAGGTLHGGSVTDGLVDAAVSSVLASGADLVSLNEVCEQQVEAVGARLREGG